MGENKGWGERCPWTDCGMKKMKRSNFVEILIVFVKNLLAKARAKRDLLSPVYSSHPHNAFTKNLKACSPLILIKSSF